MLSCLAARDTGKAQVLLRVLLSSTAAGRTQAASWASVEHRARVLPCHAFSSKF